MNIQKHILQLISDIPLDDQNIIIWGTGLISSYVFSAIQKDFSNTIDCFIDDNEFQEEKKIFGYPVQKPDYLDKVNLNRTVILIATKRWRQVGVELLNRNYTFGKNFFLTQRVISKYDWLEDHIYPEPVFVGKHTNFRKDFVPYMKYLCPKMIGSFCSIAEGARIVANHPLNEISTHWFPWIPKLINVDETYDYINKININSPVSIGNDVWIGYNAVITPGANIGNGVIIGANSVVTNDVPDFSIVAGSPAKIIKMRFNDKQIEILNRLSWWNWSDYKLKLHINYFRSKNDFFKLAEDLLSKEG